MSEPGTLDSQHIIRVTADGMLLAYIVRATFQPAATAFVTESDLKQQVGFVVYPTGSTIPPHVHKPVERHLVGTSEVLVVRSGACEVDIYSPERRLVETYRLPGRRRGGAGGWRPWLPHAGRYGPAGDQAGAVYGPGR